MKLYTQMSCARTRRTRQIFSGRTIGKLAPGMGFHHDFTGKNTSDNASHIKSSFYHSKWIAIHSLSDVNLG